jgi:hypothetical protein
MKTYSFDCFDFEGAVCKVHLIRCRDDRHALAEARAMLSAEPSCFAVEVWREDGRVGRLDYRAAVA